MGDGISRNDDFDPLQGVGPDRRKFLGLVLAGSVAAVPLVTSVGLSGALAATPSPNVSGATTTKAGTTSATTTSATTTSAPTTTATTTTTAAPTTTVTTTPEPPR